MKLELLGGCALGIFGAVATGSTAAALATPAPAPAPAATITVDRTCVVNVASTHGSPILVTGTGFVPGDRITLEGPTVYDTATAGPDGSFSKVIVGPILDTSGPSAQRFTLNAHDFTTSGTTISARARFMVANFAFGTTPSFAAPGQKVRFSFSGFKTGAEIYAHYVRDGTVVATQRFGRAKRPCGTLTGRYYQYPGGHPRPGSYRLQLDNSRRYSPRTRPAIISALQIFRF